MTRLLCSLGLAGSLLLSNAALANAATGEPAPAFRATDATGESHTLTDYIGEWVVLEWFHPDCDAVKNHYDDGQMSALQKEFREQDVKWLTVVSSQPGPGNVMNSEEAQEAEAEYEMKSSTPILLDETGVVARAYGVEKAPQVFVIDPQGTLVYTGAPYANGADGDEGTGENYLRQALTKAMNGEEVEVTNTQPYGCDVKL